MIIRRETETSLLGKGRGRPDPNHTCPCWSGSIWGSILWEIAHFLITDPIESGYSLAGHQRPHHRENEWKN